MKVVCIIQARVGSSRLPDKVLKKICGKSVLEHDINRLRLINNIDEIVIATTIENQDDLIVEEANRINVKIFRGSENDVLSRYYYAAKEHNADVIVRVTSDCPLIDCNVTNEIIQVYKNNEFDYVSNTINRTFPRGLDVEVFSMYALEKANNEAVEDYQREHVTPYIWENDKMFKIKQICSEFNYSNLRLTLDTIEDYELINKIYEHLYINSKYFGLDKILLLYNQNPEMFEINKNIKQKHIQEKIHNE